jgi:hypothetical protein
MLVTTAGYLRCVSQRLLFAGLYTTTQRPRAGVDRLLLRKACLWQCMMRYGHRRDLIESLESPESVAGIRMFDSDNL